MQDLKAIKIKKPTLKTDYPWSPLEVKVKCCEPSKYFEIKNLSLRYGSKLVFENVNLDINQGCITAIVGPSGCGKTSFLGCINKLTDLIPTTNVQGELKFEANCILNSKIDSRTLRRKIGMIFQKSQPFPLSIRKNLTLPLVEIGIKNKAEQNEIIEKVLKEVGLWAEVQNRLDHSALELSGGQQQRLCIARALTLRPEVLLMDEPCSALDPISSGIVEDLILSLRGKYTVVIVTHNLAQARRIADYVAVFWVEKETGKLIEYGDCQQIFENPQQPLTKAYVSGIRG